MAFGHQTQNTHEGFFRRARAGRFADGLIRHAQFRANVGKTHSPQPGAGGGTFAFPQIIGGNKSFESGDRPAVAQPGGAHQSAPAALRSGDTELSSVADAGTICRTVWSDGGGLPESHSFRRSARLENNPHAFQPPAVGRDRGDDQSGKRLSSEAASLSAPGGKPDVLRAGRGAVGGNE